MSALLINIHDTLHSTHSPSATATSTWKRKATTSPNPIDLGESITADDSMEVEAEGAPEVAKPVAWLNSTTNAYYLSSLAGKTCHDLVKEWFLHRLWHGGAWASQDTMTKCTRVVAHLIRFMTAEQEQDLRARPSPAESSYTPWLQRLQQISVFASSQAHANMKSFDNKESPKQLVSTFVDRINPYDAAHSGSKTAKIVYTPI